MVHDLAGGDEPVERGHRFVINGETQRGVGFYQFMNRNGKRSSAAYAYLAPLAKDSRISVKLHSKVSKVNIENGCARSVRYVDKAGAQKTAHSN